MAGGTPYPRGTLIAGKYCIFRPLVTTDTGFIYAAENQAIGRPCAIEIVEPRHLESAPAFLARLRRVGKIGSHPSIVEIFDSGVDDAGAPFIAMGLLEGEGLRQHLTAHAPLPSHEVTRWLDQLGDALDQAHQAGVVHGGLRAGCLFVTRDRGGQSRLEVTDFGVAEALGAAARSPYAAPEQLTGEISPAVDVFAMGLVAYELFTGHDPLQYWDARGIDGAQAKIRANGPRVPPSERAGLESLRLPAGFDGWFERATAADPSARHPSAGEAAQALEALVSGGPSPALASTAPRLSDLSWNPPATAPAASHPPAPLHAPSGDSGAPAPGQAPNYAPSHHPAPGYGEQPGYGGAGAGHQPGGWGAPPGAFPPPPAPSGFEPAPLTRRGDSSASIVIGLVVVALLVMVGGGFLAFRLAASDPVTASAEDDDDGAEGAPDRPPSARSVPASHATASVPVTHRDPSWGDATAPVTIVIFSDFECPFCSRVETTLTALRAKYGERALRLVWKDHPLPFHKNAMPAHEAAQAVFELGGSDAFWKFHASAFANQKALTPGNFALWASAAGVSPSDVQRLVASGTPKGAVEDDMAAGKRIGVRGTPAFFINGIFVSGAQPQSKFEAHIDDQAAAARRLAGVSADAIYPTLTNANFAAPSPSPAPTPTPAPDTAIYNVPVSPSDPQKGPADALVTIVEIGDFQCPYCAKVQPTLAQLISTYGNDLRLVWKDNPLPFHKRAEPTAVAAHEVFEQKGAPGFWKFHDLAFANQNALEDLDLLRYAQQTGASGAKVQQALASGAHLAHIKEGQTLADDLDAKGTPSFFINGRKLTGAQPFDRFKDLVDEQLTKAKGMVTAGTPRAKLYEAIVKSGKGPAPPETKAVGAPPPDAPFEGPANAPVVIQVFTDFQCPFCSRLAPTLDDLLKRYPTQVKIVFRHNPLAFHTDAPLAHEAAMEAYAQKGNVGFWKMHDLLFDNQKRLGRADLEGYAKEVGLDMTRFERALDTRLHQKRVQQDVEDAKRLGITGAPSAVINDYFLSGAQPAAKFERLIELSLKP